MGELVVSIGGRCQKSPNDELSTLFLPGGSTTIRHVGMPDVPWFDLLLRLKPVIKRTLTEASFVVLEGACGDPFVECG